MQSIYVSWLVCIAMISIGRVEAQSSFVKHIDLSIYDRGISLIESNDGRYIITGHSYNEQTESEDVLLLCTDTYGNVLWFKLYGGVGNDNGWSVRQTSDEGFIIAGFTDSFGAGGMDIYLIRTDNAGNMIWEKTFGGESDEFAWDVQITTDQSFIVAAQTNSFGEGEIDAYLIKVDSEGKRLWASNYGGEKTDRIFSVQQTPDDGYLAAGISYSLGSGNGDAYLLKTNEFGEMLWQKKIGGDGYDVGHSILLTDDEDCLMTGYGESYSEYGGRDIYLIKTDLEGEQKWLKVFGRGENDRAMKSSETSDGGFITVGFTQMPGETGWNWDALLLKTDADAKSSWLKTFGEREKNDSGYTVCQTSDGGFILTGWSQSLDGKESSILLIKTDRNGN